MQQQSHLLNGVHSCHNKFVAWYCAYCQYKLLNRFVHLMIGFHLEIATLCNQVAWKVATQVHEGGKKRQNVASSKVFAAL
jgi:hypothetical protein